MISHQEIYKQNISFPIILRSFLPKVQTLPTTPLYIAPENWGVELLLKGLENKTCVILWVHSGSLT